MDNTRDKAKDRATGNPADAPRLLVDAYPQIFRGYFAVRALTTAAGVPTNAIFAMTRLLLTVERDYGACDGAFVFDRGKCTARLALAPSYKANRPAMPDDLRIQIEPVRDMIRAFGWPILEAEGFEADDLIAAASRANPEQEVLIVTSDKDLSQLIDDRVRMLVPNHDGSGFQLRDAAATMQKFGVPPTGMVDYLALTGDSADNIPGVPGVGPKTAAALLVQFGSINAMLAAPEKIARKTLRGKIAGARELLELNRRLITLNFAAPLNGMNFKKQPPDLEKIRTLAREMELRSILRELDQNGLSAVPRQEPTQMKFNF